MENLIGVCLTSADIWKYTMWSALLSRYPETTHSWVEVKILGYKNYIETSALCYRVHLYMCKYTRFTINCVFTHVFKWWFWSFHLIFPPRLPNRPVINTAIVSTAVHSEGPPLPPVLDPPITLEYTLLETEERTKPVCVFWNHSLAWAGRTVAHKIRLLFSKLVCAFVNFCSARAGD